MRVLTLQESVAVSGALTSEDKMLITIGSGLLAGAILTPIANKYGNDPLVIEWTNRINAQFGSPILQPKVWPYLAATAVAHLVARILDY